MDHAIGWMGAKRCVWCPPVLMFVEKVKHALAARTQLLDISKCRGGHANSVNPYDRDFRYIIERTH